MKIRFNAKSAPLYENYKVKVDSGFKNIEVQLIKKYLSKNEYEDTARAIQELGIDISIVHTPLVSISEEQEFEICIIHLLQEENVKILDDTCKFAQYIAELENRRIKVVIHTENSADQFRYSNLIEDKIGPALKEILNKYPDIDFVLENTSIDGETRFNSIIEMNDVSYAASKIKEICGDRIFTLIDTCHDMMTKEAWKRFTNKDLTNWDESFKQCFNYDCKLGLVHLNNIWDNGRGKDHGRPFDLNHKGDLEKLEKIMKSYEKYANCEITIEVGEDDYLDIPHNLIKTKESLEKLGYQLELGGE